MKNSFKKLLDELIYCKNNRKPLKLLKKAYKEEDEKILYSTIGWLLQWHKEVFFGTREPERFPIGNVQYKNFQLLFQNCEELNEIFSLHPDHLGFASALTEAEKQEVRQYVQDNYKVELRIRYFDGTGTRKFIALIPIVGLLSVFLL